MESWKQKPGFSGLKKLVRSEEVKTVRIYYFSDMLSIKRKIYRKVGLRKHGCKEGL